MVKAPKLGLGCLEFSSGLSLLLVRSPVLNHKWCFYIKDSALALRECADICIDGYSSIWSMLSEQTWGDAYPFSQGMWENVVQYLTSCIQCLLFPLCCIGCIVTERLPFPEFPLNLQDLHSMFILKYKHLIWSYYCLLMLVLKACSWVA